MVQEPCSLSAAKECRGLCEFRITESFELEEPIKGHVQLPTVTRDIYRDAQPLSLCHHCLLWRILLANLPQVAVCSKMPTTTLTFKILS